MKIIGTIKHRFNEDYISKVSNLYELGITDYRFNYSKIEGNLSKEELFYQDVLKIQSIGNDIRTIIDIPYPRKKMRIVCQKNSMQINDGEKYILHIKKYNFIKEEKCNELWLDNDLAIRNFRLGMELIYDDGSGAFCVTEIYNNQNIIILKALNRFKLQNMKSISFGFLEENTYSNVVNKICKNIMPNDIALSFVENKFDLVEINDLKKTYNFSIISKIETQKGIKNIEEIIDKYDSIMLGRGDLFLNSPINKIYAYEQMVSNLCKQNNVNLNIATGFMNSCIYRYIPSISDIVDLTYAISLSPEAIVLNVDLVMSEKINKVVELINILIKQHEDKLIF